MSELLDTRGTIKTRRGANRGYSPPMPVQHGSSVLFALSLFVASFVVIPQAKAMGHGTINVASSEMETELASFNVNKPRPKSSPMAKRFGFGAMRTVSALNGLYGNYFLGNRLSLGLVFGLATFSHREADDSGDFNKIRTVGLLGAGPELFFWPSMGDRKNQIYADIGIGARTLVYWGILGDDGDDDDSLDTPLEFDVEVPLALRLFIGKNVAITPEFGFVARIIPGRREPDANNDADNNPGTGVGERLGTENGPGLGFEFGNHTGMFMGISIGYYFDRRR